MISRLRQREFNARYNRLSLARPQKLVPGELVKGTKKIVYVMTHVSICGGVKVIFEHANRLKNNGWDVCIISHFPKPDWYPISADYQQVPFGIELAQGIPLCDVIVATYWDHIQSCIETGIAPVVYFEQGDEHLFNIEHLPDQTQLFVKTQMQLPSFIMTVSHQAADLLKKNYSRDSVVVPNAIDHGVFFSDDKYIKGFYILIIGNVDVKFKGIQKIINVFHRIKENYPGLELYWINPKQPDDYWVDLVDRIFVNPPQDKIAELFRNATMFVSASEFESFSLPVLEAMATGCPVVSTNNFGVREYAIEGKNIVLSEIGSDIDLERKIIYLLENEQLRKTLSSNGILTARQYNWDRTINGLMEYLVYVSSHNVILSNELWDIKVTEKEFVTSEDFLKFQRALSQVPDDYIYVPVIYNWIENHPIARWELAATRKDNKGSSSIRVFTPIVNQNKDIRSIFLGEGIQHIINEDYLVALNYFVAQYSIIDNDWKKACCKWIILCLIELERDNDALIVINDVIELNDRFTDCYYLYYLLLCLKNSTIEAKKISDVIRIIGDCMEEPEWFYNLNLHLEI